jgi:RNA polymerase sigma-70 factor (ECF subfamily)
VTDLTPGWANGPAVHDDVRVPVPAPDLDAALRAAQKGDEDGFRTLYRAVQPGLLRYLRVLASQDADDVASETWLQIARDFGRFRGDVDDFRGWATTIARNRALDVRRRQSRRPPVDGDFDLLTELAAPDDTASEATTALATEEALQLIAQLPQDQAEAVLLRVVVGLDANRAAEILGKRPGAVRTSAYRGLNRLSAMLTDYNPRHA